MRTSSLLALSIGLSTSLASTAAWACGGTFCDNNGGNPMPVDQTGEDILFVLEGDQVEAHVRIQYEGDAEKFAWLVPLKSVPEISVGSEALFVSLSQVTAPQWFSTGTDHCEHIDYADDEIGDDGGEFGDDGVDDGGPPELLYETTVGAFEIVVLQGGSAGEVIEFLDANGYAQDPEAEPILQEYLDEGFLFAAIKLTAGTDVDAIHPLVFRSTGDEPCVPIRLTRIAAKQDMGIRAYFLGNERWAPTNYEHVVLNPARYDWWKPYAADSYLELLSLAVDEAGGQAFATEYAGPPPTESFNIFNPSWNANAFVEADPISAIDLIAEQGLNQHALIQPLLLEFIPPPDGVDPQDFWNNIADYAGQIDQDAWSGPEFAAVLTERIIDPGQHAIDLLGAWPKLTRLHTTMSPAEMTVDPMFHTNPDLPDVEADRVTPADYYCTDAIFHVAIAGEVTDICALTGMWPGFVDMPAALRIERIPMSGPPQVLADNAATVLEQVAAQQADVTCKLATIPEGGGGGDGGLTLGEKLCGCATTEGEAPIAIVLGILVLGIAAPIRRRRRG